MDLCCMGYGMGCNMDLGSVIFFAFHCCFISHSVTNEVMIHVHVGHLI
jgi:hypothetical protein